METLWAVDESKIQEQIKKGDPFCSKASTLEGMDVLSHCLATKTLEECLVVCGASDSCKKSSITASAIGVNYCIQMWQAMGKTMSESASI